MNAEGTDFLLRQCEQLNVKNFLYISSISVKFTDISRYYYAQSKLKGEEAVRKSKLKYTIVRPTIVIGRDSAIMKSLSGLAKGFIIPIFGDGKARIQPVHVDDLIEMILNIVEEDIFMDETYDLDGPEVILLKILSGRYMEPVIKISLNYFTFH